MQSVKSCFSGTLFRKNLTRFWPLWGVYFVMWLYLPLNFLLDIEHYGGRGRAQVAQVMYTSLCDYGTFMAFTFGILVAMAVFSYLYSARSANMLHALPVKRECLFVTNYLSGLAFLVAPLWITGLVLLAVQAALGANASSAALLWMLVSTLEVLFFYSFAVFCAMFTGHILALPAFYIILNFLASALRLILDGLFAQFLYGYTGGGQDWLSMLCIWLTPVYHLMRTISYDSQGIPRYSGIPGILLYALVGLVLTGLALVAYRKRKLESAGDVVAVGWVRPVFKYGVAFSAAVVLGGYLTSLFINIVPKGIWGTLIFLLLGGVVGYFAAEMLLKKSFKVFRQSWKGAGAVCLVLALAGCVMAFDLIGFNRAPAPESVREVRLQIYGTMPEDSGAYPELLYTDPERIAAAIELHNAILAEHGSGRMENREVPDGESAATATVYLNYTLSGGGVRSRRYEVTAYSGDLGREGSIPTLLDRLVNDPAQAEKVYFGQVLEEGSASLVSTRIKVFDTVAGSYVELGVEDDSDRAKLLDAIRQDLTDGALGRRYLFYNEARTENCAVGDIVLEFYEADEEDWDDGFVRGARSWNVTVTPQTTATRTIAVLKELGILDDTHLLITHAQEAEILAEYAGNYETNIAIDETMLVPANQ